MVTLAKDPTKAPIKIVSKLLDTPKNIIKNVLSQPESFIKNGELFLSNPAGNFMGALSAVSCILTFMDSVSWICDFCKNPKQSALSLVKLPYTCVEGVVKLGIALIKNPGKAAGQLIKSLIRAPEVTVRRFLRSVGLKKRKKRKHETPQVYIDPAEQTRIAEKYAEDLTNLYSLAHSKWFIDPYKTIEDYHYDLLKDWNTLFAYNICQGNYFNFLAERFKDDDISSIRKYSPWSHYYEAIPPPEFVLDIINEAQLAITKVEIASDILAISNNLSIIANEKLNVERKELPKH